MSEQKEVTINDLKKHLTKMIRDEMKNIVAEKRGWGYSPYIIEKLSSVLQMLGVPCFTCKFCDILFPNDVLWKIKGKPLCANCRESIVGNDKKVTYL